MASPSRAQRPADRATAVGRELQRALTEVLGGLPGAPYRPNQLARLLRLNRDIASRVLSATAKPHPLEVLHRIPGPEPLRKLLRAAEEQGAAASALETAQAAVEEFDDLIRHEAGTRAALDARISAELPGARERFETASKYAVFKGLSQLKGVSAKHWLGTAVVCPSSVDDERIDLTWLTGAVALQRLRPGVVVHFGYRDQAASDPDTGQPGPGEEPGIETLDRYCENPPAPLEATAVGKKVHYTLPDEFLGPKEVVDMFVVDHHPAATRRYADTEERRLTSFFVEPAVPVGSLVFDVLLHDDVYPGAEPNLFLYDTGYDGIANVNDRARDFDRVDVKETVEFLGRGMAQVDAPEIAHYGAMLRHLADRNGWDPTGFRGYRTRIQYPVYGWQVCLAFEPPPRTT